jgi:hypothetical protein
MTKFLNLMNIFVQIVKHQFLLIHQPILFILNLIIPLTLHCLLFMNFNRQVLDFISLTLMVFMIFHFHNIFTVSSFYVLLQ